MQTITLIDNNYRNQDQASHNRKYAEALLKIPGTSLYEDYYEFRYYNKRHYIRGLHERVKYISKIKTESKIFHFLVLDFLYRYPIVFILLKRKGIKIIATLHNTPRAESSKRVLRFTSRYIDIIVVHSDYLREQLNNMGITNVVSINYPALIDQKIKIQNISLPENKIKIVCLGGTRFGKGADIAINAAGKMTLEDKDKALFIFAGKEEDIKYSDICKIAKEYSVNILVDNRVLPESDYWGYINTADAVFIPYRSGFAAASGPMTDAVSFGKTIIGPSTGNLGYTIKTNEIGYTFEAENIEDISNTLHVFLNGEFIYSQRAKEYKNSLSVDSFIDKYNRLYRSIRGQGHSDIT